LCHERVAAAVRSSMGFRQERGEWWVHVLLLMPDHLHALMSFARDRSMRRSVAQWKRYVATRCGVDWQRDFFDHRLRDDESWVEKAAYIRMNPVRAGLAKNPEAWPYVWTFADLR